MLVGQHWHVHVNKSIEEHQCLVYIYIYIYIRDTDVLPWTYSHERANKKLYIYIYIYNIYIYIYIYCLVGWGCRIYQLHLCRGVRPPMSVLDMILNNRMVRFQWCWSFGECRVPLHCHCSQVYSGPEWSHLIGPYLWVK